MSEDHNPSPSGDRKTAISLDINLSWVQLCMPLAVVLSIFLLWAIPKKPDNGNFTVLLVVWLLAITLYLIGTWSLGKQEPLPEGTRFSPNPRDWAIMLALLIAALLLRVWALDSIPFTISGDEASQGLEALRVVSGDLTNPFRTGWYTVPTMSFFFESIFFRFIESRVFAIRLPYAVIGSLSVPLTYWLISHLFDRKIGLYTALLVLPYHFHVHYSRLGSVQIVDVLIMVLSVLFLYRGIDKSHNPVFNWALAGTVSALGLYFYAGARLAILLLLGIIFVHTLYLRRAFLAAQWKGMLSLIGGFLIAGGPMIAFAIRFPVEFNARVNQVGIFQSGWLQRELELTGRTFGEVMLDQFLRSALVLNFYQDRAIWYKPDIQLLGPVLGAVFMVGLVAITIKAITDLRLLPIAAWWWAGVLLGGMLVESTPSSQRLVTIIVPTCFIVIYALYKIFDLLQKSSGVQLRTIIIPLAIVLFTVGNLNFYFNEYSPKRIFGGENAEFATLIAPSLIENYAGHEIFFLSNRRSDWNFSTFPFLTDITSDQVTMVMDDVTEPAESWITDPDGAIFIVDHEREAELTHIRAAYPDGRSIRLESSGEGVNYAILYIVDGVQ